MPHIRTSACGSAALYIATVHSNGKVLPSVVYRPNGDCTAEDDQTVHTGCVTACGKTLSPRSVLSLQLTCENVYFHLLLEGCDGLLVVMFCRWNKRTRQFGICADPSGNRRYLGTRFFRPIIDCGYLIDQESVIYSSMGLCSGFVYFEANLDCSDDHRRVYSVPVDYQCCDQDPICPTLVPDVNDVVFCFFKGMGICPVFVKKVCDRYQVIDPRTGCVIITTDHCTDGRYVFANGCKKFILYVSDDCVQFVEISIPIFGEVCSLFVDCDTVRLMVKSCGSPLLQYIVLSRPAIEEWVYVICDWKLFKYSSVDGSNRGEVCLPGWSDFIEKIKSKCPPPPPPPSSCGPSGAGPAGDSDDECPRSPAPLPWDYCVQDVQIDDVNGNPVVMVTGKCFPPAPNDGCAPPPPSGWIVGYFCNVECGTFIIKCAEAPCIKFGCSIVCQGNDFSLGNCTWMNVQDPCSNICVGDFISSSSDNALTCSGPRARRLYFDGCDLLLLENGNTCKILEGLEGIVLIDDRLSAICWKAVRPPTGCQSLPTSSWRECWLVDVEKDRKICLGVTVLPPTQCDVSDFECGFYLSIDVNFEQHCRSLCIYKYVLRACTCGCQVCTCGSGWSATLVNEQQCAGEILDLCGTEGGSFSWLSRTCQQGPVCAVFDDVPMPMTDCNLSTSCDLYLNPPEKKYKGLRCAAILLVKICGKFKVLAVIQNPSKTAKTLELWRDSVGKCRLPASCYENDDCLGPKNKICVTFNPCDSKTICLGVTSKALVTSSGCGDPKPTWSVFTSLLSEWLVGCGADAKTFLETFFGCEVSTCQLLCMPECDWPCECPLVPSTCTCSYSLCLSVVNCEGAWSTHCVPLTCHVQAQCFVHKETCSRKLCYRTVVAGCC